MEYERPNSKQLNLAMLVVTSTEQINILAPDAKASA